ncbi:SWI/SNF-related matrix-associated actin-dependent regulator of chromatin subfamily A-like protein 1 [Uloborus diversus]|uniref:SWI/SNF-related matrix-associated actin-dependent regulator of chromatin subfamily A-like protein 1 n=1 Tax=Uloborus diversus TaxID=327109 RepID=UPI002409A429|nr:SWI/SNF-related matrix-associated actin-dependent regulator of chromatin subfamily A-like protein 1 [Uloborus diversus]
MSQLTEEQRRKIEENRRKALEKRAAKTGSSAVNTPVTVTSSFSSFSKTPQNGVGPSVSAIANNFYKKPETSSKFGTLNVTSVKTGPFKNNSLIFQNGKLSNSSVVSQNTVKGTCVLLSRKRFFVDVGFHKEMIDLFKTIPSRLYDVQTKKWNFALEDHDKLNSSLKSLQPNVLIAPLPNILLKTFMKAKERREVEDHDLSSLDPVLLKALLPFQVEGVNFGIQHCGRILLADDMGLGKTIQAIAIAYYYRRHWPLLVVTPSSVRYSWAEAFRTWLPSVGTHDVTVINNGKDHVPNDKVILISYDLLAKMVDVLQKRNFKCVIMDESHFLKNPKSRRTKAALSIMKNMNCILMLTGTPALSRPVELYTQLSALRPREFFNYVEYGIRYCNGKTMPWGWDFSGSSNMEELQLLLEETVMIRRLKSEVIKQLPSKSRQMIVLDPSRVSTKSKVLKAMYEKMHHAGLKGMEKRGALLEYFHETGEVKIPAVCEYILDVLESDKKFLCFAHHQNVMQSICDAIEKKKVDYIRIDGSVSAEQRKKLCDHFQMSDSCKVAVLSITAANCGITLTAASLVIFAELFWNPGILTQAEDRAHRIGQEDSVLVQYLVAKGTADDEIWPLVQRKLEILNKAGLSKDNFKTADTVIKEDSTQPHLEDFWNEIDEFGFDIEENSPVPEKRMKLDS